MLNEKKIRLMTRTAIYEKREGKEDLKVNSYCVAASACACGVIEAVKKFCLAGNGVP